MRPAIQLPRPVEPAQPLPACRHRFPALEREDRHGIRVFADNSSRAQMPDVTLAAVAEQLECWETHRGGQPRFDSPRAARATQVRERARRVAAAFCGGTLDQIGFAANGTSTLAILARAMFGSVLHPGDTIVITEADHDANRTPWLALRALGCRIIDVPVSIDGGLDREAWQAALAARPRVVAFCMLSNVTGVLLPYAELATEARGAGAVVVLDAVQGPPHGYTDVMLPQVDVGIFSNCKLFSPHLGWWAIRPELLERMGLQSATGAHPALEWGTFAHAGFAGFVATHDYLCNLSGDGVLAFGMASLRAHEAMLTERFIGNLPSGLRSSLLAADTPHPRVPIFSLALPAGTWPRIQQVFHAAGIDARIGQFGCPATLRRLAGPIATALRLSFVHYNSPADIDAVTEALGEVDRGSD